MAVTKRGLLLLVVALIIFSLFKVFIVFIQPEPITGQAHAYGTVGLTIGAIGVFISSPLPPPIYYPQKNVSLVYKVIDTVPVDQCYYQLNNQSNVTLYQANGSLNTTISGSTTFLGIECWNNLTVFCNNSLGTLRLRNVLFVIDTIPPVTTDDAPKAWQRKKAFNLTLNASDACSGVNYTKYFSKGMWYTSYENPTVIEISKHGNNSIFYYSVDNANNTESMTQTHVLLDQIPLVGPFKGRTTKFALVDDLTNVSGLILEAVGKGMIKFPDDYSVNAAAEDYASNVYINDRIIAVKIQNLHATFNDNPTLYLFNLKGGRPTIYYAGGFYTDPDKLVRDGKDCIKDGVCSFISYKGGTLQFKVSHLSSFAVRYRRISIGPALPAPVPCVGDWNCTDWSICSPDGLQTRACIDQNACGIIEEKPDIIRSCVYVEPILEIPAPPPKVISWKEIVRPWKEIVSSAIMLIALIIILVIYQKILRKKQKKKK